MWIRLGQVLRQQEGRQEPLLLSYLELVGEDEVEADKKIPEEYTGAVKWNLIVLSINMDLALFAINT